ncbi:MAG: acyltransferase [Candidatus Micrarchaeia archaeon]
MIKKILKLLNYIVLSVITNIEGPLGSRLRYLYYKNKLSKCNRYFSSEAGFKIDEPSLVTIGKHCSFNRGVLILAGPKGKINIGDYVMIGPYTFLRSSNHGYANKEIPIKNQDKVNGDINIGTDVWIGGYVAILKGVRIGNHSIIAAQSLVNKDVPECSVVGGIPAKIIKKR